MKRVSRGLLLVLAIIVINRAEFTEDLIKKVCHNVKITDDVLVGHFQALAFEDRDKVFPHMKDYIEAMEELVKCYHENEEITSVVCKDVIDEGAPKFMNLPYDLDVIEGRFNWTMEDTEELYSLRAKALDVWCELDNMLPPSTHVDMTSRTTWLS